MFLSRFALILALATVLPGASYGGEPTSAGRLAREAYMRVGLLRPGMSQEQVLMVLGGFPSEVTVSPDDGSEKWDYWYFPPGIEYESHARLWFNGARLYVQGKVSSLLTHYQLRQPPPRKKPQLTTSPKWWDEVAELMWSLQPGLTPQEVEKALGRQASASLYIGDEARSGSQFYSFALNGDHAEGVAAFAADGRLIDAGVKSLYFEDILWGSAFRSNEEFGPSPVLEESEHEQAPVKLQQKSDRKRSPYGYNAGDRTIFIPSSFQIPWVSQDSDGDGVPDTWTRFTRVAQTSDAKVAVEEQTARQLKVIEVRDRNEDGLQDAVAFFCGRERAFRELMDTDLDGFFDVETLRRAGRTSSRSVYMKAGASKQQRWW